MHNAICGLEVFFYTYQDYIYKDEQERKNGKTL